MYYYKHHIIPFHEWKRRINSKATRHDKEFNAPDNVVWLTIEQHIQAHQLLWELHGSEWDRIAYLRLSDQIGHEEAARLASSLNGLSNIGRKRTREQNQVRSRAMMGNKIGLGNNNTLGRKFTYTRVECPNCGTFGGLNMMHRYHFERCKFL